jgi:hypothetical protein
MTGRRRTIRDHRPRSRRSDVMIPRGYAFGPWIFSSEEIQPSNPNLRHLAHAQQRPRAENVDGMDAMRSTRLEHLLIRNLPDAQSSQASDGRC